MVKEAVVKEAVVKGLLGDGAELKSHLGQSPQAGSVVGEMVDEGLVTASQLQAMGASN